MVTVEFHPKFKKRVKKIKDELTRERIKKAASRQIY